MADWLAEDGTATLAIRLFFFLFVSSCLHHATRLAMALRSQALRFRHFSVTFPGEHIVQVTLDRQDKLNCVDKATSREIAGIWEQFDEDASLWVGIITGAGRAFCTGADLIGESARCRPPVSVSV